MLYLRSSFTVPASNKATQEQWDQAFLTADELEAKYGEAPNTESQHDQT